MQLLTSPSLALSPNAVSAFLDAVPLLRTEDGVGFMASVLMQDNVLTEEKKDQWFGALAFYKTPTRFMIASLTVSICSTVPIFILPGGF